MKIGIHYTHYNDCAYILYALQNFDLRITRYFFELTSDTDVYRFTSNYDHLIDCDKKIKFFHTWEDKNRDADKYDKLVHSMPGESYQHHIPDNDVLDFLNQGNICLAGGSMPIMHENFFYEPYYGLIYFYYFFGYDHLNYYKFDNKVNLCGIYHRTEHVNKRLIPMRNYIYDSTKDILQDDLKIYESKSYKIKPLIESYTHFRNWGNNHISGYTDYTTSVCNIVYETCDTWDLTGGSTNGRTHVSEKTLKSIIFCEEDIFFIWYGTNELYKYLTDLGFWFLNSEFYNDTLESSIVDYTYPMSAQHLKLEITPIEKSVIDASEYLKQLKVKLGSNANVYRELLKIHGSKLTRNVEIFNELLRECRHSATIINLLKK
jgi:hypothetical protein